MARVLCNLVPDNIIDGPTIYTNEIVSILHKEETGEYLIQWRNHITWAGPEELSIV